ncbi:sensor histidine kinase [Maribacter sp. MAR_2009_72]|uniref:sensor histidine kinase n=1 Tax=Maribacter sp. MAR_2009_72 TaxID=1250050 RepID=UPI00119BA496|nr:histidine kinase [Maribacter sp. MAR_2009_72]TVZ14990.1 histidine kinase [Maribacter sp. MAR_2009_72]
MVKLLVKNRVQILVHISIWMLLYGFAFYPVLNNAQRIPSDLLPKLVAIIALFYINYFYLVPALLLKKNVLFYIMVSLVLLLCSVMVLHHMYEPIIPDNAFFGPGPRRNFGYTPIYRSFISFGIPYVISAILRLYVEWKRNENLRLSVEKESIKSELQLLKAQLNPHFLFNTLNTIYALSVKKSPDTSQAIVDLSELMRYMLYEADKDLVPLNKELDYIKSYIQLQRLRLSDSENVSLKITGEDRGRAVPPLLFISFIENAFKYGTDYKGKTYVKITLTITDESIYLNVKNKIGIFREPSKNSGIGLENIRNQLELIYPALHELKVDNDGNNYEVSLTIYQLKQGL